MTRTPMGKETVYPSEMARDGGRGGFQRIAGNDQTGDIQRRAVGRGGGHGTGVHADGLKFADNAAVFEEQVVSSQGHDHREDRDHHTDDNKPDAMPLEDGADTAANLHADRNEEQHQEESKEQVADHTGIQNRGRAGISDLAFLHTACPGIGKVTDENAGEDTAGDTQRKIADFYFADQQTQRDGQKDQEKLVC